MARGEVELGIVRQLGRLPLSTSRASGGHLDPTIEHWVVGLAIRPAAPQGPTPASTTERAARLWLWPQARAASYASPVQGEIRIAVSIHWPQVTRRWWFAA